MPSLSDIFRVILQSSFVFIILLVLCALPVVIYRFRRGKDAWAQSPRKRIAVICALTIAYFVTFTFYDLGSSPRIEATGLPAENALLWYIVWAILLLGHWCVWFLSMAKSRKPTSLSFLLPCLLFLAVGFAQENWLLIAIMTVYTAACFIPKGAET